MNGENKIASKKKKSPQTDVIISDEKKDVIGNYTLYQTIGTGTFGKVKLAIHIPSNEKVAIKILDKQKIREKDDMNRVLKEMKFLKSLNHPNIIKVYEILENAKFFFLVLEYADGGELFHYIVKKKRLIESEVNFFFFQIINGLEYIHKNNIAHRDMKPENLLLTDKTNKYIKIIDFGLSNDIFAGKQLGTPCGSPCYAAPEMILGKKYSGVKIDIWSSGIILFAMACGYLPFEDKVNQVLFRKIIDCKIDFPNYISSIHKDLIKKILVQNPKDRISLEDIKKHAVYLNGKNVFCKNNKIYNDDFLINKIVLNKIEEKVIQILYDDHKFSKELLEDYMRNKRSVSSKEKYQNISPLYEIVYNKLLKDHEEINKIIINIEKEEVNLVMNNKNNAESEISVQTGSNLKISLTNNVLLSLNHKNSKHKNIKEVNQDYNTSGESKSYNQTRDLYKINNPILIAKSWKNKLHIHSNSLLSPKIPNAKLNSNKIKEIQVSEYSPRKRFESVNLTLTNRSTKKDEPSFNKRATEMNAESTVGNTRLNNKLIFSSFQNNKNNTNVNFSIRKLTVSGYENFNNESKPNSARVNDKSIINSKKLLLKQKILLSPSRIESNLFKNRIRKNTESIKSFNDSNSLNGELTCNFSGHKNKVISCNNTSTTNTNVEDKLSKQPNTDNIRFSTLDERNKRFYSNATINMSLDFSSSKLNSIIKNYISAGKNVEETNSNENGKDEIKVMNVKSKSNMRNKIKRKEDSYQSQHIKTTELSRYFSKTIQKESKDGNNGIHLREKYQTVSISSPMKNENSKYSSINLKEKKINCPSHNISLVNKEIQSKIKQSVNSPNLKNKNIKTQKTTISPYLPPTLSIKISEASSNQHSSYLKIYCKNKIALTDRTKIENKSLKK